MLEQLLTQLDSLLGSAFYFPFLLVGAGLFFTLYLGFPQIRFFTHGWKVLFGRYSDADDPGDTSHFQALSTALSGTVGTGNIGGVALALYLGGPAALFWMWITALVGMTTKFVEVTLSHKYRKEDANGQMAGGPMYFMEYGLNLKWLAVFFAVATVISSFGSGNMPQSNNMAEGLETSFGIERWMTGAVLSIAMFAVIVGGIKRIAAVAGSIVPIMALLYAIGAFAVIVSNIDQVVPSFIAVFTDAFSGTAATGGFLGASFAYAFNRGINRGLYSNEAGQGSAPIAHAAARTKEPVAEGMVAILEPFIDTLIICTLTGLVILSSGVWKEKFETDFQSFDMEIVAGTYSEADPDRVAALYAHLNSLSPVGSASEVAVRTFSGELRIENGRIQTDAPVTVLHNRSIAEDVRVMLDEAPYSGILAVDEGAAENSNLKFSGRSLLHSVPLTLEAFKRSFLGDFGQYVVSIGLVLFAFSTAVAWSYYGDRAITYLFGVGWVLPYRVLYVGGFFVATIADTSLIWLLSYITVALMTIPNLIGLFLLRKEMKSSVADYWDRFDK